MLFVLALPSCAVSCGAVLCCVLLLVVCGVFGPVVASVCCGTLSLPASTHKETLIIALCYPAPVSVSAAHILEESGLVLRRFVVDPDGVVFGGVVLFLVSFVDCVVFS